jgi:hypothetical protein
MDADEFVKREAEIADVAEAKEEATKKRVRAAILAVRNLAESRSQALSAKYGFAGLKISDGTSRALQSLADAVEDLLSLH